MLTENIVDSPGQYRNSDNDPQGKQKILEGMQGLVDLINDKVTSNPVKHAAHVHLRFFKIAPFENYNGSIVRLMRNRYPLTIISNYDKDEYLNCLGREDSIYFLEFVTRCVMLVFAARLSRMKASMISSQG